MEWPLVKALLWALAVFLQIQEHRGCFEEERVALLELKAFLKSNAPADYRLPLWSEDVKSDCCGWERVTCNSTTGRAIELSLGQAMEDAYSYFYLHYSGLKYEERWLLNVSLFVPFTELRSLDLSCNQIGGCLPNEGFEKLSNLHNLKMLSLGYNYLDDNNILQSLVEVTSLETLNITLNRLDGHFSTQGSKNLSRLKNLKKLDLSYNKFNTSIIKSLSLGKSIKNLNLAGNMMNGSLPAQELSNLENLKILDLSSNLLNGVSNVQGSKSLSRLKNLEKLDLSYNKFNTSIIKSLSLAKSTKNLNLAANMMNGSLPTQELSNLENLKTLDLSSNLLNGVSIVQGSKNLSRLKNLKKLDLSYNKFNTSIIKSLSLGKSIKNLNLAGNMMNGSLPTQELSNLENLKILDLSSNLLNGVSNVQGPKSLSRLENLEILDLSDNKFNTSILKSLNLPKSIKNLNLAGNLMNGSLSAQEFSNLEHLKILDLSSNLLNGFSIVQGLANFSRLEALNLESNKLTRDVFSHIGALSSLKAISLAFNNFSGTLPQELCGLVKLEELDLKGNLFEGILPSCLKNLTSLRLLDISWNQFSGNISLVAMDIPKSIVYMDFSLNHFEGILSFSLFGNHSKLEVICFANEKNSFEIETESPMGWSPLFQLKVLLLCNCNLNKLTHNVPRFLVNQHKVEEIDLSHNQLEGRFPDWLLEKNTTLQIINIRNNSFIGKFHLQAVQNLKLLGIDVSNNHLDGKLQENIGELSVALKYLNLSQNCFEGFIPSSITKLCHLEILDLSSNNFFGELPKKWDHNCSQLAILKLSNNQFNGTVPKSLLQINLYYFDISNNKMSGPIPKWIQSLTSFNSLVLSNNSFEGQVPCELGLVSLIDLSYNLLSGWLPSCLNLNNVEHLFLRGNKLTGSFPKSIFNSSSLLTLDLSNNNFFGHIPNEMGALSNLRILLLRDNHFNGMMPNKLCRLKSISIMDISKNLLSGSILDCLHNMSFGKSNVDDYRYGRNIFLGIEQYVVDSNKMIIDWYIPNSLEDISLYDTGRISVLFATKHRLNSYIGNILNFMSGLDLSCNKLTSRIPLGLMKLSSIHALNLSYNGLIGSISGTFSNLANLESLDLSHNNLSGKLPSELINMNFLEVFSVAYNNLLGRVPEMKAQFGTFDKSIYEGNPFLCGEPLENSCAPENELHPSLTKSSPSSEDKWYKVDIQVFFPSFFVAYIIFFLTVITLFYINPHWQ